MSIQTVVRVRRDRPKGKRRLPTRFIYTRWDRKRKHRVAIKRYRRAVEARAERNAMRSLPISSHLLRYFGYYVRNGHGYIVMEWVKGPTLRRVARRRGPFQREKVIDLALEILKGLEVMHRGGYIHGDFHAENVMVPDIDRNMIKIIDFQHTVRKNAKGRARARRRLPRPPFNLAPETRRWYIDDRYDIYGVGYMCAYLMLGTLPTRRRLRAVRAQAERDDLWRVIFTAMHPDREQRYRSAREMIQALKAIRGLANDPDGS